MKIVRVTGVLLVLALVSTVPVMVSAASGTPPPATSSSPANHAPGSQDDNETETSGTHTTTQSNASSSTSSHTYTTGTGGENETETQTQTQSQSQTGQSSQNSTSSAETSTQTEGESEQGHGLQFQMVSAGSPVGSGEASIVGSGTTVYVNVQLDQLAQSARFALYLVVNGSNRPLGNFTTSGEGHAEIQTRYSLLWGHYDLGIAVYRPSGQSWVLAMTSSPASLPIALTVPSVQSSSSSETETEQPPTVTTIQAHSEQEGDIQAAIQTRVIPAVIHVGTGGVNYTVLDSNFTLFVGTLQSGGLQITVSGVNGTSSRVLLVNLTSPQVVNLQPSALTITFDGAPVTEAASVTQVVNPSPGSPPLFVLVATSTGYQLLVLIPHFSTHVIQILPAILRAVVNFWILDGPVLVLSVLAVTSLVILTYMRRPRLRV